ncbi:MAG TPA: hypothetical protein VFQ99_06895 [Gallionella sp.]|nr:hypothetical protein [Gallionella sp.]
MQENEESREVQSMSVEGGTVALLNKSEIDMQIATAHRYPRSITKFRKNVQDMVTISEAVAQECIYAIPRDGKVIEGPSARFAEVVASAWGNSRAGARVVNDQGDFVTAQGVYHDLEQNVAITYEVQRRITNKSGKRFGADMIGVTANAACSIALRNAILKGIPKAFWSDMYQGARQCAMGDVKTLPTKRAEAFKLFLGYGISKEQILARLGVEGEADIGQEELLTLRGLITAIKEGDTTPEQAFADTVPASTGPKAKSEKKAEAPAEVGSVQRGAPVSDEDAGIPPAMAKPSQIQFIKTKAFQSEISEAEIFKRFGIETLEGINIKQVDAILSFLANPAGD